MQKKQMDNSDNLEYNKLTRMMSNSGMLSYNMQGECSNRGMEGDEDNNSLFSFNFLDNDLNIAPSL